MRRPCYILVLVPVLVRKWQINIHGMLGHIPSVYPGHLHAYFYFCSIDSRLSAYENLSEAPMLLDLAISIQNYPNNLARTMTLTTVI
jgi:hypothetical protein